MEKNQNKRILLKNTIFLYILQFSSVFFNFITIPYQARVLGPSFYGKIGVAVAISTYFQLFLDFGFSLLATADVANAQNDKTSLMKILTSINILKLFFSLLSIVLFIFLCIVIPFLSKDWILYSLYLLSVILNAFLPDFLYRGMEKMQPITIRTVIVKGFFSVMIFFALRQKEDYLIIPTLLCIGNAGALIGIYWHVFNKLRIFFCKVSVEDLLYYLKRSSTFFFSRIADTVYSTSNTIILGSFNSSAAGFYTSVDKIRALSNNCFTPISDSIYPYMIKNKDYKLIKKVLWYLLPPIFLVCIFIFIFAKQICIILFGIEFLPAYKILQAITPMIIFTLPIYLLGFPTLGAMGIPKYANFSIYTGTIIHIINLTFLIFTGNLNMVTLTISSSLAEAGILIHRIIAIYKNREKLFHK